jgi:hypothetical protein
MTLVDQCVKRVTSRGGNVGLLFSGFDYTRIAAISGSAIRQSILL